MYDEKSSELLVSSSINIAGNKPACISPLKVLNSGYAPCNRLRLTARSLRWGSFGAFELLAWFLPAATMRNRSCNDFMVQEVDNDMISAAG